MDTVNLKPFISLFYKGFSEIPLANHLGKEGNTKIPSTTAIFNMSSAKDCPSKKLGLCKACEQGAKCYARRAEYIYPCSLPYRQRQEKFWKKISGIDFARQFIMVNSLRKKPFLALRMNEAGDFHSQACVDKVETIARILKRYHITTYMYTSRNDLSYRGVRDAVIHGSNFTKPGIKGIFKIIRHKRDKVKGYSLCRMNCRICKFCQKKTNVCVLKH